MDVMELFWDAPLEDLKTGRVDDGSHITCLLCGYRLEKGFIYCVGDRSCEAWKAVDLHIEEHHGGVFQFLLGLDKKFTGLTDHQSQLLKLFGQGLGDEEVRQKLGIGSASTVRNHRFQLKERERQARVFLVLAQLLSQRSDQGPSLAGVPPLASPADERWNLTVDDRESLEKKFFPQGTDGPLVRFPLKEKQRAAVLLVLAGAFEPGRRYSEKEVTEILRTRFADPTLLRRQLVEHGLLDREGGGGAYWRTGS